MDSGYGTDKRNRIMKPDEVSDVLHAVSMITNRVQLFTPLLIAILPIVLNAAELPAPVILSADGALRSVADSGGNKVLDFSFAGYRGGGVALPIVRAVETLNPSGGDDSAAIEAAIGRVAALPLKDGHRGAVELAPGEFSCSRAIEIKDSGVVLRGAGSGKAGTRLHLTGRPHAAFELGSTETMDRPQERVRVTDSVVPSGADQLSVEDPGRFTVGQEVEIVRPVTREWVHFMGMDVLVRDGKQESWVKGDLRSRRTVSAIDGHRLTFDMALADRYDQALMGPEYVSPAGPTGNPSEIGVESLSIECPAQHVKLGEPAYSGIRMRGIEDSWVRDLSLANTLDTVSFGQGCRRVTALRLATSHASAIVGAAKPADFSIDGSQILVDRCTNQGDEVFYVATGAEVTGPNVVLHCTFTGGGWIQPHQRWATGLLVDSCSVPGGGIDFMNRGEMGSGHGWTIAWAVAWNCSAKSFIIQNPPGSANWAVGCVGSVETEVMPFHRGGPIPTGNIASMGTPVAPASLYLAQLAQRKGPAAVAAIGY